MKKNSRRIRLVDSCVLLLAFHSFAAHAATPDSGWWWNPAEGGRGYVFETQDNTVFMAAYMYAPSGGATWYAAGPASIANSVFSTPLTTYLGGQTLSGAYRPTTGTINNGNISVSFSDASHGTITWPGGTTTSIERYDIVSGGVAATPPSGTPEAGWWWNAAEGGRGFAIEIQNGTMFMAGYMYDDSGNPVWYTSGPTAMNNPYTYQGNWQQYGNGQILGGAYKPAQIVNANAGTVKVVFDNATSANLTLPDGRNIALTRYAFGPARPAPFLELPVRDGENGNVAYGIWPYGVHGSSHSYDGHPGLDFEFTPGASVLAAYDGTVYAISNDTETPGRYTFNLLHSVGGRNFQTFYTNVQSIAPGITVGAAITKGTALGAAGTQTQFIGSSQVTYAMTHFQLNDNSLTYGLSNPGAISPMTYFTAAAKTRIDGIWNLASYRHEICEPLLTNPRGTKAYPTTVRNWTLKTGSHHSKIEFRCVAAAPSSENYTLYDAGGNAVESGTVNVQAKTTGVSWLDLQPTGGGSARYAVYDIVNGSMRLDYGVPGAARPSSLNGASTYCSNTPDAFCK